MKQRFSVLLLLCGALLASSGVVTAAYADNDVPQIKRKHNPKIHFAVAPHLQRFVGDGSTCGAPPYYGYCYYFKTLKLRPYRLVFRLNHDPAPVRKQMVADLSAPVYKEYSRWVPTNDARATVQEGSRLYHDGFKWHGVGGFFTTPATAAGTRMLTRSAAKNCFSKIIALPRFSSRYRVGNRVKLTFRFPRSKQKIVKTTAPIIDGAVAASSVTGPEDLRDDAQVNDVAVMGCLMDTEDSVFKTWPRLNDPNAYSPVSWVKR